MLPLLLLTASPWKARAFRLLATPAIRRGPATALAGAEGGAGRRSSSSLARVVLPRPSSALWAAARRSGAAGAAGKGQESGGGNEYEEDGQQQQQGQGPGVGRGPRNRRRVVNNPSEEDEFAALSAAAPPRKEKDGSGPGEGARPGARRITRISRPTERPKKAPLSVNPNWTPKGPKPAPAPARKPSGGRNGAGAAAAVAAAAAAADDEEDDLLDLPEGLVVRALDSKAYEEARRLSALDDDDDEEEDDEEEFDEDDDFDEEFDEDEDEEWDLDDEEDDDEMDLPPLPPPGKGALSMAERLKMAQSGTIYNPYVMGMHAPARSKSTLAGGRGGKDDEDGEGEDEDDWGIDDDDDDGLAASPKKKKQEAAPRKPQPLKYQYKIVMDVGTCPGCGNSFQTRNDSAPGFVPTDVYERLQARLMTPRKPSVGEAAAAAAKKKAKAKAEAKAEGGSEVGEEEDLYQGLSAEEEVELLLSGKDRDQWEAERAAGLVAAVAEFGGEDEEDEDEQDEEDEEAVAREALLMEEEEEKMVICQRCHKLKHYGEVEDALRPGWSDNELLTPERFRDLLSVVRKKRCAVVCLVDIFDFHGSLLYNLPRVVGENPVLVAVNKADLLPADFSEERVRVWVKQELEKVGMKDVSTRDVHLVSCKTGHGVKPLLRAMKTLARTRKRDLYVIGAANVGKSTFINRLIELGRSGGDKGKGGKGGKGGGGKGKGKGGAGKEKKGGTLVTTSPLPGTTLNFIEVDLGDKVSLYDTPGLILRHQITTLLTTEELKAVIPQKRINHVTLRLKEGKSVLLGGLVRLDMVEGRPFLFTFYASNDVKLHQTATDRADEFLQKHVGELVFPPYSAERLEELGPWVAREFDIEGTGWKTSAVDIVISGLGWVSVTGALNCKVRVMAPESVGVRLRSPLMPYETWDTTARWTGLRAVKTGKKAGSR